MEIKGKGWRGKGNEEKRWWGKKTEKAKMVKEKWKHEERNSGKEMFCELLKAEMFMPTSIFNIWDFKLLKTKRLKKTQIERKKKSDNKIESCHY